MKSTEFIKRAKELMALPNTYVWGGFFNNKTNGAYHCDCSGLIKAIMWGYPGGKYESNGLSDHNANTIISKDCTSVSTNMSASAITPGEVVWMDGHIGIYVGNGYVIESTPKWKNKVQKTKLTDRTWKKHGKLKSLEYEPEKEQVKPSANLEAAINTIAHYVINGTYGNGHATRSSAIYQDVKDLVNGKTIDKTDDLLTALKKVATEVKRGTFGNGHEKRESAIYNLVRDEVNESNEE